MPAPRAARAELAPIDPTRNWPEQKLVTSTFSHGGRDCSHGLPGPIVLYDFWKRQGQLARNSEASQHSELISCDTMKHPKLDFSTASAGRQRKQRGALNIFESKGALGRRNQLRARAGVDT